MRNEKCPVVNFLNKTLYAFQRFLWIRAALQDAWVRSCLANDYLILLLYYVVVN